MSSPGSCFKCSRLAPLVTPSGLCVTCAATEETAAPSRVDSFPPPDPPLHPEPATASFVLPIDPTTLPSPGATEHPLPAAPPGYDLFTRLGGGGMGDVYLAREHLSERTVAMKFLRNPGDPAALERFVIELRVLAKLDHPNIVRVYASDFLRAAPYFTMEFVPGGSLARPADGARPVAEAVRLVRTIAAAVAVAHGVNVIHRDLKPSNILLGLDGAPKIADFGLAKRLDESDLLTVESGALGTPGYMPPEQVSRKNGEIGVWSDVYGLGATLYHTLVGRAPFVGDSIADTITKVLVDPPERVRRRRPDVSLALEGIVMKCLEKDPKDRYQSVAELLTDLDRYEAGLKPEAPQLTWSRRLVLWAKQNRRGFAACAAALVLAAAAFVLGGLLLPTPDPAPAPAPPDPWGVARAELQAGHSVRLVGPGGEMGRYAWRAGSGTFGKANPGDGVLFETIDAAMLELLDDPGIDRYTIRAEIQQTRPLAAARLDQQRADEDVIGVYFGLADLPQAAPPTRAFFAVWFADFDPQARLGVRPVRPRPVRFDRVLQTAAAPGKMATLPTTFAQCMFNPVDRRPGEVRTIEIDVTPDEIQARWVEAGNRPRPLKGLPPISPAAKWALLQEDLDKAHPKPGVVLPPWSPRRPVGIYARSSALNVRSLTVTPTP